MYVKVKNGIPVKSVPKPKWYDTKGNRIHDDAVFIKDGIYPAISNEPKYNKSTQDLITHPTSAWIVHDDYVEVTFTLRYFPVDEVKESKCREVDAYTEELLAQGMTYTFSDSTSGTIQLRHPSVASDRSNIHALGSQGLKWSVGKESNKEMPFIDAENNIHMMKPAELVDMSESAFSFITNHTMTARQHKDAILNINSDGLKSEEETLEEIDKYDYTIGW